jgi:hypothetical protein
MVAEAYHDPVRIASNCPDAGLQRAGQAFGMPGIVDKEDRQTAERRLDPLVLVSGDDDHGPGDRRQHPLDRHAYHRLATDLGEELVDRPHSGRAARGQHHRGDPRTVASLLTRARGRSLVDVARCGRAGLHAAGDPLLRCTRRAPVICAMMATAISAGETAPIANPIGA